MSSYSDKTYENLMESALSRLPSMYDKREGSMLFNGNAPCLAELAQMYIALDFVFESTYIATAPREYLIRRAADRSMKPYEATPAVYKAYFNMAVPIGSRFSADELNFVVTEQIEDENAGENRFAFRIQCETAGSVGNNSEDINLIPIEYINGLSFAQIGEKIISGEDEEETEHFRQRVIEAMRSISFSGNVADYKEKIFAFNPAIKGVKVYPVWNENLVPAVLNAPTGDDDIAAWYSSIEDSLSEPVKSWLETVYNAAVANQLTVGGVVRIVLQDSFDGSPSESLIADVQEYLDPQSGEGLGLAPIGHIVTVDGVQTQNINVSTSFTLKSGFVYANVEQQIKDVLREYFAELGAKWSDYNAITVYRSQIDSHILNECPFVENIVDTTINGESNSLVLGADYIPVLGTLENT